MLSLNGNMQDVVVNGNHTSEDMEISMVSNGVKDKGISSLRQTEILRCFAQYLLEKNYKDTYDKLVHESGVVLENHNVAKLRESVLNGNWVEAEEALCNLKFEVNSDEHLKQMQFLILEQRILEAMEDKNFIHGVELLRERLTPMNLNRERVHHLATCLMYKEIAELHNMASWKGKNGGSRELLVDKLQGFIPAQVMLPPKRLENLFNMAMEYQIMNCPYHNCPPDIHNQSLLHNHDCAKKNFPTTIIQNIKLNKSELWICKFSPDGKKLIVGGKENNLVVFNVNNVNFKITQSTELKCIGPINFIVWSWDSRRIAACSVEENGVYVFDVNTDKMICNVKVHDDEPYNCAAFLKDNNKLAVGSLKGIIYIVDVNDQGKMLAYVDGYRAQSMVILNLFPGNDHLLVADTHKRIRKYQFGDGSIGNESSLTTVPAISDSGIAMMSGFPVFISDSAAAPITAPTSVSASSESVYVTRRSTVPSSTNVSEVAAVVAASNSMGIPSLSPHGLANQMLQQWVSSNSSTAAAITTTTPNWLHPAVPIISSSSSIDNSLSSGTIGGPANNIISISNISSQTLTIGNTNTTTANTTTTTSSSSANTVTSSVIATSTTANSNNTVPSTITAINTSSTVQLPYTLIKDETLFEADSPVQSIVLSKANDRLLISLNKVGLSLWHLPSKQILQRFVGTEQKKFTLHPTFGGYNEEFIACGSETGYICIWHYNSSIPVEKVLLYPDSNISCVHWNPENHNMIAGVNDAGHVYIIGPSKYDIKD